MIKIILSCFLALFIGGCAIGNASFAMDREKTTHYDQQGRVVAVVSNDKVNQPIAKSSLATASFMMTSEPFAAAVVAAAQSLGDSAASVFKKTGDTANDVVRAGTGVGQGNTEYLFSASVVGEPQPIPAPESEEQTVPIKSY